MIAKTYRTTRATAQQVAFLRRLAAERVLDSDDASTSITLSNALEGHRVTGRQASAAIDALLLRPTV